MRRNLASPMFTSLPPTGPITKVLCALLLCGSVVAAISQRNNGFGINNLIFSVDAVLQGEIWRIATYVFIKSTPFGVLLSGLVLWMFGRWYETSWGSKDFLRFFLLSSWGAALLAIPICLLLNSIMPMWIRDLGVGEGPDAAMDAMLVAMALNAPEANVLFGFLLPVPIHTLLWLLIGMELLRGLMNGAFTLSMTLSGMIMGYLLVTGTWRPTYAWNRWQLWRLRRRRRGIYVVPPRDKRSIN